MKREHFREKLTDNVKHLEKIMQYVGEVKKVQDIEELDRAETLTVAKLNKQVVSQLLYNIFTPSVADPGFPKGGRCQFFSCILRDFMIDKRL